MSRNELDQQLAQLKSRRNELITEIQKDIIHFKDKYGVELNVNLNNKTITPKNSEDLVSKAEYIKLRDKLTEVDFIEKYQEQLTEVPKSNGSEYFSKLNVNIGIIADEFLYNSFKDVANFHYINYENYKEYTETIEVFIVASAWKGLDYSWKGMGNPNVSKIRKQLFEIIKHYKQNDIKIVFYSKEDPTNYEFFVDIAKKCDYIFTTAIEKVRDYKRDCSNENVFVLEFGVNPIYNNPIGINFKRTIDGALFAGSWYKKYPHRQVDSRKIFDGVIESKRKLKIIDRNYWLNLERHFYPTEYLEYVSPSVDHETLQSLIKLYPWTINLNSIKDSETMYANRVFELQAMGSAILSNYSLGINFTFPNIFMIFNSDDVSRTLNHIKDKELYAHQLYGVRKVLDKHTTFHRITNLLKSIGIDSEEINDKRIAVIVKEKSTQILEMFNRQTQPNKYLLTYEEFISTREQYHYLTFFDEAFDYGEFYLQDMINGFKYTDVSFITKDSYYDGEKKISGIEHGFISEYKDKAKTVFSLKKCEIDDIFNDEKHGIQNGYSIDSLELNMNQIDNVRSVDNKLKYSVIVPVFNNGDLLYGKCFMSLRRSPSFEDIEIILVDDGSTDEYTVQIVDRLTRLYPNVKSFKFDKGGSGSASRPRNKGVELATTNYITYLYPDNELVNNGFDKLYENLIKSDNVLVVGNILKIDKKEHYFDYYADVIRLCNNQTQFSNDNLKEFFKATFFKAQSIQALMVKKDLIVRNELKMVPGAIGQDTLFYYELLSKANCFEVINEYIHVYYAAVKNSTVNNVNLNFFNKYELLESEKYKFLVGNNLLDTYLDVRFNYYFKNWYLKKLKRVRPEDEKEALKILRNIFKMYNKHLPRNKVDPIIEKTLFKRSLFK